MISSHSLGIPDDAERVLILAESSHWDPNWLFTSEEYYERFVRHNLDQAIEALLREPRRVYSIECIFFLRMYWERRPEQQPVVRELINAGQLRLTSSGVTTTDTLLPSTEALLRDWLMGQEWLRANGMEQEPTLAYFTDSFGCTPNLPSLLRAAGFDRTAITRVDGMHFPGCEVPLPGRFPRPGSSAQRLLEQERTLDFIWRDRNGAEALCHWNAFTYGQGDMLASVGLSRVYLMRLALARRTDRHIARRIKRYVAQLAPYSPTRYLFCPIGYDFVEPIPDLLALLDRYNRNHYPATGVWAVNAGLDDYLALVETHRERLPVLELDPNPYWTGFYSARPTLKQRCRNLVDRLLLAEKLACRPEQGHAQPAISQALEDAWWWAAVSNHHDFITGTSPDRVVEEEQLPWLDEAADAVDGAIQRLAPASPAPQVATTSANTPTWQRRGSRIQVSTPFYEVEWDENAGGAIVRLQERSTGASLLAGVANDLVSYRDSGGLWRMGYEFSGGVWKESARASQRPAEIQVRQRDGGLEIASVCELDGETFRRRVWLSDDSPLIHFFVEGKAAEGHSVTVRFATGMAAQKLLMDAPGGMVARPPHRVYDPTFWPLHTFVHFQDSESGRGLAVMQPLPGAVAYGPDGRLELVAMRNATREKIFGWIGIPGNPASGHEREPYVCHYALLFTPHGDWRENHIHRLARTIARSPWSDAGEMGLWDLADSVVTTDSPDVWVTAVKPAARGEGLMVRLHAYIAPSQPVEIAAPGLDVTAAWLCDARERDMEPLPLHDGAVRVPMTGPIATVRLLSGSR